MSAGVISFSDNQAGHPAVQGFLHTPAKPVGSVLVLTHGAGGNCNTPLLVALGEALATKGVYVLRCDLPFRQLRPKGPPSPSNAKLDQAGLRRAVALMRERFSGRVYLGGQSYGGRQGSLLAASEPGLADGLLLLSYPLHPPGRTSPMRTAHFPDLRTSALFVHGTADPFASSEELNTAVKLIPAPTRIVEVTGTGHSLLSSRNRTELPELIAREFIHEFRV